MKIVLHSDPLAASSALTNLDLTEDALLAAVMQGYLARINCTANHPPLFASFVAWGETVRALREQLGSDGWVRDDEKNYSRVVHPNGHLAIAVATGDEATGVASGMPTTKSPKGPSTADALKINQLQAWLPGMEPPLSTSEPEENQPTTWLLLVHHAQNEIRSELSLPVDLGIDSRVSVWRERILLKPMPLDIEPIEIAPPDQADIEVVIKRKA